MGNVADEVIRQGGLKRRAAADRTLARLLDRFSPKLGSWEKDLQLLLKLEKIAFDGNPVDVRSLCDKDLGLLLQFSFLGFVEFYNAACEHVARLSADRGVQGRKGG